MVYEFWQSLFKHAFRRIIAETDTSSLPQEAFVLVSNHVDWLDGLLLSVLVYHATRRMTVFVARTKNWRIFGNTTIVITEDRERIFANAERRFRRGDHIGFFPEGYRNSSAELAKGKIGAADFAVRTGATVVPVGIRARSCRNLPESLLHLMRFTPTYTFGTPRNFREYRGHAVNKQLLDQLTTVLMQDIAELSGKTYPYSPTL